jgi:hypothetical protein
MYSRITPQALFYTGEYALSHKFVVIEEKAGSEAADYPIRALQSRHELSIAATIKNPETGKMQTTEFRVYGPTAFLETTTASRINYENSTRCFEIYLDESAEQTRRIHDMQRFLKTAQGRKLRDAQEAICKKHHNAQRLLQPVRVIIPFAPAIEFPASWLRTRRDHQRFLNLIEVIAFLHQYQKQTKTDPESGRLYIEADLRDYEIACDLAKDILPETLSDLKKPVADLLSAIESYAGRKAKEARADKYEVTFSRRAIREETGLQNYRIKELFKELEELEYLGGGEVNARAFVLLPADCRSQRETGFIASFSGSAEEKNQWRKCSADFAQARNASALGRFESIACFNAFTAGTSVSIIVLSPGDALPRAAVPFTAASSVSAHSLMNFFMALLVEPP